MFRLNRAFFLIAIMLLVLETCIAIFLKDGFIRHTFGDFLVVILIYCFLRSFIKTKPIYLALVVLSIAFLVEFLQLAKLLELLNLENNKLAKVVLGSTFQINDLFAYTIGTICIYYFDNYFNFENDAN